jgi:hypothetical protein
MLGAYRRGLVDDRVEAKRSNQRDLVLGTMQPEFQDTVGQVAHQFDRYARQPAPQQTHHLMRALTLAFCGGAPTPGSPLESSPGPPETARPTEVSVQGTCTTTASTRPSQAGAAHRAPAMRSGTVAVMSSFANLRPRAPFQGFVDHAIQRRSRLDKLLQDQGEKLLARL